MKTIICTLILLFAATQGHAQTMTVDPAFEFGEGGLYDLESRDDDGYWLAVRAEYDSNAGWRSRSEARYIYTATLFKPGATTTDGIGQSKPSPIQDQEVLRDMHYRLERDNGLLPSYGNWIDRLDGTMESPSSQLGSLTWKIVAIRPQRGKLRTKITFNNTCEFDISDGIITASPWQIALESINGKPMILLSVWSGGNSITSFGLITYAFDYNELTTECTE